MEVIRERKKTLYLFQRPIREISIKNNIRINSYASNRLLHLCFIHSPHSKDAWLKQRRTTSVYVHHAGIQNLPDRSWKHPLDKMCPSSRRIADPFRSACYIESVKSILGCPSDFGAHGYQTILAAHALYR